jgi:hypothetical protein
MKRVYEETGKYLYDISKIILGVAVITPVFKGGSYSVIAIGISALSFVVGAYFLHKGENYGTSTSRT